MCILKGFKKEFVAITAVLRSETSSSLTEGSRLIISSWIVDLSLSDAVVFRTRTRRRTLAPLKWAVNVKINVASWLACRRYK